MFQNQNAAKLPMMSCVCATRIIIKHVYLDWSQTLPYNNILLTLGKSSPEIHNSKPKVLELVMKTKVCHCCQTDCVLQLFYRIISHHHTCVWWWLISLLANPHHILDSQWNHFDNHGWPMICGFIQHCNAQAVVEGPYTMNLQSWSM